MSDLLRPQPFSVQLRRIVTEYERTRSIFGIHESLFWRPRADAPFAVGELYGRPLANPIGPSAGPHTQLSQNIVAAWLCGGRFMELKTVQVKDELEIPRPCIDMQDEGYNVEWSQELRLAESAREYVNAWALVHVLPRVLGWEGEGALGTIFDMSVGYDLAGVRDPRMVAFVDTLLDASAELEPIRADLRRDFPELAEAPIPSRITTSVTLSTMHGCPPSEIEGIARYMLEERGLHTVVKLNPTLLGKDAVLEILHEKLGFREIEIPDSVFAHDLGWDAALALVGTLREVGAKRGLAFGVKLSNTLAMSNHRKVMPGGEMYMSGRALYPVTMNLYAKLAHAFGGDLRVSYSAGADADNVATIAACGAAPITACTDLLKPGGYARMGQWLSNLERAMTERGASSLSAFAAGRLDAVRDAAAESLENPRYQKGWFAHGSAKVSSGLGLFDCIEAPCTKPCAVCQDVPEYAWAIDQGDPSLALEVVLARNPLPAVTGYVCTQLCQTRCTRNEYDEPVAIRALKRFAEEHGKPPALTPRPATGRKVAVVGSGPSGLSAAFFLALSGVEVDVFEARDVLGGMMRLVPVFRLPWEVVQRDVDRIVSLGVRLHFDSPVHRPPEELLREGYDAVYVAIGFQRNSPLDIPGADGPGVHAALDLLDRARRGERVDLGKRALVVGGGDSAMDATRTAARLTGAPVKIVYRRTRAEMPASHEEIADALAEGNELCELATPLRVVREDGRMVGLECMRNELGAPGADGRRRPVPVAGSEFVIPADSMVVSVGQSPEFEFLRGSIVRFTREGGIAVDRDSGQAGMPGLYAGGDAAEKGPGSIIAACADGRLAAESMCRELGVPFEPPPARMPTLSPDDLVRVKRARASRVPQVHPATTAPAHRGFELIESSLTEAEARREAARCLQCSQLCDKCVEVCPNRANQAFVSAPMSLALPRLELRDGAIAVAGREPFAVAQARQIVCVNDFCNECGTCSTFCVHEGQPFRDKPRLFLDAAEFAREEANALHLDGATLRRREGGHETRLTSVESGAFYDYETDDVRVRLTPTFELVSSVVKRPFTGALSLRDAAEMAVLLRGVTAGLPHLAVPTSREASSPK